MRRGLSISEYGVTNVESGEVFKSADEDDVYEFLGYEPIPPELRENSGELEAARRGELPKLVELRDVRGDLHTHSHWSADGKSTLEEMLEGAAARGYQYYAVTDHSHYLREGRLHAQLEEIEALRARFPKLTILAGVEANIRSSGEVDVADEDLALLDWVVASVHQAPDSRPTERVLEAMQNPYVDVIGHLTGRRIGKRPPRDVDVERVIEGALETGTLLEINGQPDRLDLRDVHARAAKEAGLKLVVSSDAHEVRSQAYVELAVAQARRGWLTKADVANTRTWKQLDKLRKKRRDRLSRGRRRRARVGGALSRAGRRAPGARPGQARRALRAAACGGSRAGGVVRRRPARPRRAPPAGDDELAEPALLLLLRRDLVGAGDPRRAARGHAEPGRDRLARVAASTELELRVADWVRQLLGLPDGWHGHIEDTASTSTLAALIAARHVTGRNVVVCSEHAHSSVEKDARMLGMELRKVPVDDELRMRVDGYDLDDVACVVATVGTTSFASVDPVRELAERAHAAGSWLHVDAAYAGSSWICEEERWSADGVELADQLVVVNPHKWLLVPADCSLVWTARPDEWREAFTLIAGVPAHRRRGVLARRLRPAARPPLPLAQAVGGAALLRRRGAARDPARAHPTRGALRRLGRAERRLGARRAAALLARRLPPNGLGRGERAARGARERVG